MDGSEDDLVFNYEALGKDLENSNEENLKEFEESNFNDISGEEYEETEVVTIRNSGQNFIFFEGRFVCYVMFFFIKCNLCIL